MLYSIEKTLVLGNIQHGIIFTTYQMYCLRGNFPVMKFSLLGSQTGFLQLPYLSE